MTRVPLQVYLPVCPIEGCETIGKIPSASSRRDFCTGGTKNPHRSTKMESRLFVEVIEQPDLKAVA